MKNEGRRLGVIHVLAVAAIALALVTVGALVYPRQHRSTSAGNRIQGPAFPAATVTVGNGRKITCPQGAEPGVNITAARFTPPLQGGTTFRRGTYRVTLTGVVANETTGGISIDGVDPVAQHADWNPERLTAPRYLAANSSGRLTIRGTYRSRGRAKVDVGAYLRWSWRDPTLRSCGHRGLIDDD